MTASLLTPILENGILNTNFFQGRVLSAEDLQTEQQANRIHRQHLGRAIGAGIIEGLQVTQVSTSPSSQTPALAISPGVALNRRGQDLLLSTATTLSLSDIAVSVAPEAGLFAPCSSAATTFVRSGEGPYILVMSPASGFRERAPKSGLDQNGKALGCGSRYAVEGIVFRLEPLAIAAIAGISRASRDAIVRLMTQSDAASLSKLRNWLAHLCFGSEEFERSLRDPFDEIGDSSTGPSYGAIDTLRASGRLTDCDVPLALLYWTLDGIRFLDMWSVRRKPVAHPRSTAWPVATSSRRRAEGEAAFLQFQEQIAELNRSTLSRSELLRIQAKDYFRYLPAVGMIPFSTGAGNRGFDPLRFFTDMTVRDPVFVEGRKLHPLITTSFSYTPIDSETNEMLWLYLVRQNRQIAANEREPQPVLIFSHGQVPYQGDPMYDLSYWNFSNYSLAASPERG